MPRTSLVHYLGLLIALASSIQASSSSCQAVEPSFPSNFKCSAGKECISTDSASTAICCDAGSNCTTISPITCNIQLQNASAPTASTSQLFTTRLGDSLPACGSNTCCPFGYTCTTSGSSSFCSMNIAESSLNSTLSSTTSASSTSTTGKGVTSSASPTSTNSIDPSTSATTKQTSFPPAVFIAGVIVGIVIGVLASLTWVVCTGRHHKTAGAHILSRSSTSSKRPIISAPIPFPNNSRTDFIRRAANKTRSVFSAKADERPDWNEKMPNPPLPGEQQQLQSRAQAEAPERPFTPLPQSQSQPQPQAQRKASVETIQVYSPPNFMQYPSATVPPLRAMSRQRSGPEPMLDHPFQTPPKAATSHQPVGSGESALAASRYTPEDKRGTTFTTMVAQCGIPDRGDQFPLPRAHAPYETRYA